MSNPAAVMPNSGASVQEVPSRRPGPREVRVRVRAVGVCGSDTAYYRIGRIGDWIVDGPIILGHEAAGGVAVGEAVTRVQVGDRVAIDSRMKSRLAVQALENAGSRCVATGDRAGGRGGGDAASPTLGRARAEPRGVRPGLTHERSGRRAPARAVAPSKELGAERMSSPRNEDSSAASCARVMRRRSSGADLRLDALSRPRAPGHGKDALARSVDEARQALARRLVGWGARPSATHRSRRCPFVLGQPGCGPDAADQSASGSIARRRRQPELIETLRVFLSTNSAWGESATRLRIHRQTLAARIRRIEDLIGLSLSDPDDRVAAWLALRASDG